MLVNPTSEEYKYLCCGNTSDEVLELPFSIPFSLSEACLLLGLWEPCRQHGSGRQTPEHPNAAAPSSSRGCDGSLLAASTAPGAQHCPAKMGKDAAAFPASLSNVCRAEWG